MFSAYLTPGKSHLNESYNKVFSARAASSSEIYAQLSGFKNLHKTVI